MNGFRKVLVIYVVAIVLALAVAYYYEQQSYDGQLQDLSYGDIYVERARNLIETQADLVIVDVRTPGEYEAVHIEGSINLCVTCDQEELLNSLDPNDEILLYCRTGRRSANAMRILSENGYYRVYNMIGGIEAWTEVGYAVVEG